MSFFVQSLRIFSEIGLKAEGPRNPAVKRILEIQLQLARLAKIPLLDTEHLSVPERDLIVDLFNEKAREEEEAYKRQMAVAGANNLTGYASFG